MTSQTKQERLAAMQQLLGLPMRRSVYVSSTPLGNVRIEVTNERTGEQIAWMEMDRKEADMFAGTITAVVTEIIKKSLDVAPSNQVGDAING